jgi:nucleoside phosphorylase
LDAKVDLLKEFPGGLAVETEGYVVGLLGMLSGVPYLIIRGISDRALGDKRKQGSDAAKERDEQFAAALAAAKLTVQVVDLLSQRW